MVTTSEAIEGAQKIAELANKALATEYEKEQERITRFYVLAGDFIPDKASNYMIDNGFFRQSTSTKHHSCHAGGLADHSHEVTKYLLEYTEKMGLKWQNPRSPYVIGYLHDICKIDMYNKVVNEGMTSYEYNKQQLLTGHGNKSAILAAMLIPDLTDEEMYCIRWHMGAFDEKSNWNAYGRAVELYPNVLYTHMADMAATRIKGI